MTLISLFLVLWESDSFGKDLSHKFAINFIDEDGTLITTKKVEARLKPDPDIDDVTRLVHVFFEEPSTKVKTEAIYKPGMCTYC